MTFFHANGKLLLTGEYLVLDGAMALALPTQLGQSLHISPSDSISLQWNAIDPNGVFLDCEIKLEDFSIIGLKQGNVEEAERLSQLLQACRNLNSSFLIDSPGLVASTELEFPRDWGLGSSSTLVAMLSEWASVDPYELLANTFGGSGYDIACAKAASPVFYQLHEGKVQSEALTLSSAWSEVLFVYSGQKQDSRKGMEHYRSRSWNPEVIQRVSAISKHLAAATDVHAIISLVSEHESILSSVLAMPTLAEATFKDFNGAVKSLGAWGGDFFMAVSGQGKAYSRSYFADKGYSVIFSFEELALSF